MPSMRTTNLKFQEPLLMLMTSMLGSTESKGASFSKPAISSTPNDIKVSSFCRDCHVECIAGAASGTAVSFHNSSVISQLIHAISAQHEEAVELNRLHCKEIECTNNKEEAKKDRTKENPLFHPQNDWACLGKNFLRQLTHPP